jgi:flagellar biosynthesis/type III secretory pathway protein FliH
MNDFADMLKEQLMAVNQVHVSAYERGYQAGYTQGIIDATEQAAKLLEQARADHQKFVSERKP